MNLRLWSVVMVVSMCIVFLAPSVSMNAMGEYFAEELTLNENFMGMDGVVIGCMNGDNDSFVAFNQSFYVGLDDISYIGSFNSSDGESWDEISYPIKTVTHEHNFASICVFKDDDEYFGIMEWTDTIPVNDISYFYLLEGNTTDLNTTTLLFSEEGSYTVFDVAKEGDTYYLFLGRSGTGYHNRIYYATSTNLIDWNFDTNEYILEIEQYYSGHPYLLNDFGVVKKGSKWFGYTLKVNTTTMEETIIEVYESSSILFPDGANDSFIDTVYTHNETDVVLGAFSIYSDDVYKDSRILTDGDLFFYATCLNITGSPPSYDYYLYYSVLLTGELPLSSIEIMIRDLEAMLPLIILLMFFMAIAGLVSFRSRY